MNTVDKVFEEMKVNDIIEEMGGESDENGPLSDDWLYQWLQWGLHKNWWKNYR